MTSWRPCFGAPTCIVTAWPATWLGAIDGELSRLLVRGGANASCGAVRGVPRFCCALWNSCSHCGCAACCGLRRCCQRVCIDAAEPLLPAFIRRGELGRFSGPAPAPDAGCCAGCVDWCDSGVVPSRWRMPLLGDASRGAVAKMLLRAAACCGLSGPASPAWP